MWPWLMTSLMAVLWSLLNTSYVVACPTDLYVIVQLVDKHTASLTVCAVAAVSCPE